MCYYMTKFEPGSVIQVGLAEAFILYSKKFTCLIGMPGALFKYSVI